MFKIYISLFISCFIVASAHAADLRPSLGTQMQYQTKLDKKNTAQSQAKERRALQEQKKQKNNTKAPKTENKSLAPSLRIPPVPQIYPSVATSMPSQISWVDMDRVRSSWVGWYNDTRWALGLKWYTYDARLDTTAHDWNTVFAGWRWQNHHRRSPNDNYYDFPVIDAWFLARGINPRVINRSKHTENVGYGSYSCSSGDCTDSLIHSIRSTFDFFMSEKGKSYDAHYRSIVNPYFTKIGLDIIIVPNESRYYLTVHYITE